MSTTAQPLIVCPDCGKKYRWLPHLVGRQVKCVCGTSIRVDAEALGDTLSADVARSVAPQARQQNSQAMSQALMDKLGVVNIKRSRVAEDDRADLEKQRKELDSLTHGNQFRDMILPIPFIAAGIALMFIEQLQF